MCFFPTAFCKVMQNDKSFYPCWDMYQMWITQISYTGKRLMQTSHEWHKFCNFTTVGLISRICIKQSELIVLWACSMVAAWVWPFLILPPSLCPTSIPVSSILSYATKGHDAKSRMNRMLFLASTTYTSFASWFNDLKKAQSNKQSWQTWSIVLIVFVSVFFLYIYSLNILDKQGNVNLHLAN